MVLSDDENSMSLATGVLPEIIELIALHTPVTDLIKLIQVNKMWYRTLSNDFFWRQRCLRDFPDDQMLDYWLARTTTAVHLLRSDKTFDYQKLHYLISLTYDYFCAGRVHMEQCFTSFLNWITEHSDSQMHFVLSEDEISQARALILGSWEAVDEENEDETLYREHFWVIELLGDPAMVRFCSTDNIEQIIPQCSIELRVIHYLQDNSSYVRITGYIKQVEKRMTITDVAQIQRIFHTIRCSRFIPLPREEVLPSGTGRRYCSIIKSSPSTPTLSSFFSM